MGAGTGYLLGEGVKSQTPKNSTPTYIYRYGSENGVNLTPRKEKDDFGLSYSLKKRNGTIYNYNNGIDKQFGKISCY